MPTPSSILEPMGSSASLTEGKTTYPQGFAEELKKEIQEMSKLSLTKDEASFLYRELPYLPPTYIDFVRGFRFDPEEVKVEQDAEGHLSIIAEAALSRHALGDAYPCSRERALL